MFQCPRLAIMYENDAPCTAPPSSRQSLQVASQVSAQFLNPIANEYLNNGI